MRLGSAGSISSVVVFLGLSVLFEVPLSAQYLQPSLAKRYESGWENDRVRVRRISVAPGAELPAQGDADRVLVFLTADLQGAMPAAEAIWQPAGTQDLQNRGRFPAEGILIELKNVPATTAGITPPEALPTTGLVDVRLLIDNPRVTVAKLRYAPNAYAGPWHFHPQDAVIVYLRGGYSWPPYDYWDLYRVRRGDIDVVPANTFHVFGNSGGDPLEFLAIFPK
jgi:quercetin dioxygenase-like cupin family protein